MAAAAAAAAAARRPRPRPRDLRVWPLACEITAPGDARLADSRGRSLLWWACHRGLDVARRLIWAGADVNAANTHFKRTPLMGRMDYKNSQDVIKALLAKGADMHAVSADGKTALGLLEPYVAEHADSRECLLILAEAEVFKGEAPPAKFAPFRSLAVSARAHE